MQRATIRIVASGGFHYGATGYGKKADEKGQGRALLMPGGGGGGGGGSSNLTKDVNVPAAGPARSLATYPAYNPVMYQGMQPGQVGAIPGMAAPLQSYMPAINGLPGFGGIPAQQLVQSLLAGYAGVPLATQPTGALAPGMGTLVPPGAPGTNTGTGAGTGSDQTDYSGMSRKQRRRMGMTGGASNGTTNGTPLDASAYVPAYYVPEGSTN